MKKQLIVICVLCACVSASGQNFFAQKKTKLKYIAQQIAAFQVYAGYVEKGYRIANEGWNLIDDIKNGDFDLHNNYFNSLKTVNNSIAGYEKIEAAKGYEDNIRKVSNIIQDFINSNECLQESEKQYINAVLKNLLNGTEAADRELTMVTSDGDVEMTDDERIARINIIYEDMQDKYAFVKHFEQAVKILALSRQKEKNDINFSRSANNLK
ncbi:MAG TPA: hypothetical protein VFW07_15545 [Parafilimonas sp.]|nr:hypothetical protein [Parafilimonas sp.]